MEHLEQNATQPEKTYRKCRCPRRHEDLLSYMECTLRRSEVHGERLKLDKAYAAILRCKLRWSVWLYADLSDALMWSHPEIECSTDCTGAHEVVAVEPVKDRWLSAAEYQRQQQAQRKEQRYNSTCPKCNAAPGRPCKGVNGNELKIMHGTR